MHFTLAWCLVEVGNMRSRNPYFFLRDFIADMREKAQREVARLLVVLHRQDEERCNSE